jgi:hypothetical protein
VMQPINRRKLPRDRAFARGCRTVDSNDHDFSVRTFSTAARRGSGAVGLRMTVLPGRLLVVPPWDACALIILS